MSEERNEQQNNEQKKLQEIIDRLEQGLKDLFESEQYKKYLNTMSRFHNYSINNTMLITMQMPDATLVAGFNAWQHKFKRHVNRGEKAIKILAPEQTGRAEVTREAQNPIEPEFSVAVTPIEREGSNIKGLARIYFEDSFVISNVSILEGKEKNFVAMPSHMVKQNGKDGKPKYQDICFPITKEFREALYDELMFCYEEELEKAMNQGMEQAATHSRERAESRQFDRELPFR